MNKGLLFVISAPSGTGKTTLLKKVMSRIPGLNFSVSHTTRPPRKGEHDGKDYYFVDKDSFEEMISKQQFIEWARVHDNLYGTSVSAVRDQLDSGEDVILDIDVQGAEIIRNSVAFESVQIFIAPPSIAVLETRLRKRNTEDEDVLQLRLQNARTEMMAVDNYAYLVVNDNLEEACEVLSSIIIAERAKVRRRLTGELVRVEVDS